MKKILQILVLFFFINSISLLFTSKAEAQSVSFQVFYDDLSPYGSWIENPEYGYVWSPRVSGFAPYSTNGYWVLTDFGWTWVSDYSWGWAPFHYGRWYNDPIYGYVWVPGYEWGPGWVTWRRSDDYYGWAPIGPGININVAYSNGYNIPYNNWRFVRCNDFGRRDIHNYYVDRSRNVTIINNTTVINTTKVDNSRKTTFSPGPDRMEVQRKLKRTINPVAIVDENKPSQKLTKNSVQLYRPVIENNNDKKARPAKLIQRDESKKALNNQNNINKRKENQQLTPNNERVIEKKPEVKREAPVSPIREEQKQSVQNPVKNDKPLNQVRDHEQGQRKRDIEQPVPPPQKVQPQNTEKRGQKPPVKQPNMDQPVRQQPSQPQKVQPQNAERPVQRQPDRQRNMDQPVREQRVQPQQNMNRTPERQRPVRQEPIRQTPPVQRDNPLPPPNHGRRKGG